MPGKIPVSYDLAVGHRETRIKRRTKYRVKAALLYLFIAGWLFLLFQDTVYSHYIPRASRLRLIFPIFLVAIFILGAKVRIDARYIMLTCMFFAVGLSSAFAGVSVPLALFKLLIYVMIVIPLLSSRSILTSMYPYQEGMKVFVNILMVVIFIELAHYIWFDGWLFKNPNQAGMLTVILLPLFLYGYHSAQSARFRHVLLAAVVTCLVVVLLSKSRASIGADLVVLAIFYSLKRTKSLIGASMVLGTMITCALLVGVLSETFAESVQEIALKDNESFFDNARRLMFKDAIEAFKERPLLGYGFGLSWRVGEGAFDFVLRTGRLSWLVGEFGSSTLALLAGGGLFLTAAFYLLVFTVMLRSFQTARLLKISSAEYLYFVTLLSAVGGLLVHAQAEGWVLSPLNWVTVIFWLYLSLLAAFSRTLRRHHRRQIRAIRPAKLT